MSRTSSAAVQAILGYNWDGTTDLTPFIKTAGIVTDWLDAKDAGNEVSDSALAEIEAYLAAHFYEHSDQITQTRSTGGASGSFQGQTAMVFMGTKYGQTACAIDMTGLLAKRSKEVETGQKRVASVSWLGKQPSDQLDYVDRD